MSACSPPISTGRSKRWAGPLHGAGPRASTSGAWPLPFSFVRGKNSRECHAGSGSIEGRMTVPRQLHTSVRVALACRCWPSKGRWGVSALDCRSARALLVRHLLVPRCVTSPLRGVLYFLAGDKSTLAQRLAAPRRACACHAAACTAGSPMGRSDNGRCALCNC